MSRKPPFERVVATQGVRVLRVCRALLDPHDADDAWSETFLAALRAYPALPDDANVEAWLVTIAHRKAVDVLRTRSRIAVPVGDPPERPSADPAPDARLDLVAALRRLPEKQRHAVALHHLGGLPFTEVAQVTGQSPDAARRSSADGVRALRRALDDSGRGIG